MNLYQMKLTVGFCDNSKMEKEFEATNWGNISGKEEYFKFVDQGLENGTIFAKLPHVTHVRMVYEGAPNETNPEEYFECSCHQKAQQA